MAPHSIIKDRFRENRILQSRIIIALAVMTLLLMLLLARMTYLQVYGYQHYSHLSQQNRVRLAPAPPTRGLIYDRNGVLLAENRPAFRLVVTPEQVPDLDETLERLEGLVTLRETDLERFHESVGHSRRFQEIPLKLQLTDEEVARLAVNRHRFPGVEVKAHLMRHYPFGDLTSHLVGYVGRIDENELRRVDAANYRGTSHFGKTGIERHYEQTLHGQAGVERLETNARGRILRSLSREAPVPGKDLYLTVDIGLQRVADEALGEEAGAVVALDPGTGEVLALVSKPTFDPNQFVNGISTDAYRALRSAPFQPLFNRVLRGQYPPGSTIKPFIALAGLETNTITPEKSVFCPGYYRLPNGSHRYRCWKRVGHGPLDLKEAIVQSCDVYFYDLAYNTGIKAINETLAPFGFGRPTGIDMPGELPGVLPSKEWKRRAKGESWYHGETVITGIGQGFFLTTPLQLAQATADLARSGTRIQPHLLDRMGTSAGTEPVAREPKTPIQIKREADWELIQDTMVEVVHGKRGTARSIAPDDYRIAGKTGTAQVFGLPKDEEEQLDEEELERKLRDHALFVAFAPAEDPQIAVAVVVEHGGSGSATAAPVAKTVIDAYLPGGNRDDS